MAISLEELVALLPFADAKGDMGKMIEAVAHDSRKVVQNSLFFCLAGNHVDGHNYIADAAERGAAAIVTEKDLAIADQRLTVIKVPDTRKAMQTIVPYFFGYPGRKLRMIGVTGTNGKTTTTYLIRSILVNAGFNVGLIGTINAMIGDKIFPVKNTTPDVIELQETLAAMVAEGIDYVVMEVSSHALALNRVAGCEFDVGVFSNISRDHLDFHGDFDNYIAAKAILFDLLSTDATKVGKTAIINIDDPASTVMLEHAQCPQITYGIHKVAGITARDINIQAQGASFTIEGTFGSVHLNLKITGIFNVYNVLAAFATGAAEKIDMTIIKDSLETFKSVPGRFEIVNAGQPYTVIVDYAHTPDGLENILKTAQQFAQKRIIVVFGCGGDRDRTKRPIMGKIAVDYADIVIATSDNPRTEEPEIILQEIETGIKSALSANKKYAIIADRREAIKLALHLAEADDIVLIAGKGHETYQILKDKTIPFDDRKVVREIIREMR